MSAIKLSEYTEDMVWVNDMLQTIESLREAVENGEVDESDVIAPATEDDLRRHMRIDADSYVEQLLERASEEIEEGHEMVVWNHGQEAATRALQTLLDQWEEEHLAPVRIWYQCSGDIEIGGWK